MYFKHTVLCLTAIAHLLAPCATENTDKASTKSNELMPYSPFMPPSVISPAEVAAEAAARNSAVSSASRYAYTSSKYMF